MFLDAEFQDVAGLQAKSVGHLIGDNGHGGIGKPIITSCGSGVSAAILALSLETTGRTVAGLYDGSWAEWGSRADLPLAKGDGKDKNG